MVILMAKKKSLANKFRKELDEAVDILHDLSKEQKRKTVARFDSEVKQKKANARDFAKSVGTTKPIWRSHVWSKERPVVQIARGYYHNVGFATRIRKVKTRSGIRWYLDLFNGFSRSLDPKKIKAGLAKKRR